MAETRLPIPSLYNGMSQQPAPLRFPNQTAGQVNTRSSVVDGCSNRPGTMFVTAIAGLGTGASFRLHPIERDEEEKYLIVYGYGVLRVFEASGREATVTVTAAGRKYLDANSPSDDQLRMVSVADYTFIANTTVKAGVTSTGLDSDKLPVRLVRTKAGTATDPPTFTVDTIVWSKAPTYKTKLKASIGGSDKKLEVEDPAPAASAFDVKIDDEVITVLAGGKTTKWTVQRGIAGTSTNSHDAGADVDHVEAPPNDAPSLIKDGLAISDIGFYENRLIMVGGEKIAMARTGEVFNVFIEDPANIVASDPIDLSLSGNEVTLIEFVQPFRQTLVFFTKTSQQYELDTREALSAEQPPPINASTAYRTLPVRPALLGSVMYFIGEDAGSVILYEYFYDDLAGSSQAANVTAHARYLLGSALRRIVAFPNVNTVFILPTFNEGGDLAGFAATGKLLQENGGVLLQENGDAILLDEAKLGGNKMAVYRSHWVGNRKEQSAWSQDVFDAGYKISDIARLGQMLYMLVQSGGSWYLEAMPAVHGMDQDDPKADQFALPGGGRAG